jgi:hypothetical protein
MIVFMPSSTGQVEDSAKSAHFEPSPGRPGIDQESFESLKEP